MSNNEKFTLYSYVGSQWAMVAHLGLVEKGIKPEEYEIKEIDLFTAANFEPEYLEINPNGTIPSLVSPNLDQPLIQSMDVLRWLDKAREKTVLVPEDDATKERMQQIIDLIHDESISTDLILLQARSMEELEAKKSEGWLGFLAARQEKLEKEKVLRPEHPFYGPKSKENGSIYHIYTTEESPEHHAFFKMTHDMYRHLALEMDRLEELIALPYAAGDQVTEADLNVVPWFAHAMAGAGTKPTDILNFQPLENVIRKSVENFEIGPKTKQWWSNIAKRESFKQVYPTLH